VADSSSTVREAYIGRLLEVADTGMQLEEVGRRRPEAAADSIPQGLVGSHTE
jgi:hypothetical protein